MRLLTHVLCKPTHFFFHSFIPTMSYSLQTSFNSVMKDWTDKFHALGIPTSSSSRSNTVYNGIFSATPHVSCLWFKNIYAICLIISVEQTDLNLVIYWWRYCRCSRCIICPIAHRSWQHFKMKFLWRYGRELCYTLEIIQTLYVQIDKENVVDLYNSVFSRRSENVLRFHEFSRTFHSTKTEKLS